MTSRKCKDEPNTLKELSKPFTSYGWEAIEFLGEAHECRHRQHQMEDHGPVIKRIKRTLRAHHHSELKAALRIAVCPDIKDTAPKT